MPTKMINFTGVWLDSVMARAFLLADHFAALTALIKDVHHRPHTIVCRCLSLLGHMAVCATPRTHLHMHCLQGWLLSSDRPMGTRIFVLQTMLASLRW